MWVGGNLKDEVSKIIIKIKLGGGGFWGGAWGIVWVQCIVVCQVSVVLSKYESNVIINKEVMAI